MADETRERRTGQPALGLWESTTGRTLDGRQLPSRVAGAPRILSELRRLLIKTARTLRGRELADPARTWSRRVYDTLAHLVEEGDVVLPPAPPDRRVRKRCDTARQEPRA